MSLLIKQIQHGSRDYLKEVALRQKVLRDPLGIKFTPEQLEAEYNELHFGIFENEEIVACLILANKGEGIAKMRQVAVHPQYQGKGLGTHLVCYFEGFAKGAGYSKIELHARKNALNFYQKLSYNIIGDEFEEVGIALFPVRYSY
jgi:ribosomal protein S18 acetylase RimI-like enzyme